MLYCVYQLFISWLPLISGNFSFSEVEMHCATPISIVNISHTFWHCGELIDWKGTSSTHSLAVNSGELPAVFRHRLNQTLIRFCTRELVLWFSTLTRISQEFTDINNDSITVFFLVWQFTIQCCAITARMIITWNRLWLLSL